MAINLSILCYCVNYVQSWYLHMFFHRTRTSFRWTLMLCQLGRLVLKCWNVRLANNDIGSRKSFLTLTHSIWWRELLLSPRWLMSSGMSWWKAGRIPKRWYVSSSRPISRLLHANQEIVPYMYLVSWYRGHLKLTKLIELKLSSTKLLDRAATLYTVEMW